MELAVLGKLVYGFGPDSDSFVGRGEEEQQKEEYKEGDIRESGSHAEEENESDPPAMSEMAKLVSELGKKNREQNYRSVGHHSPAPPTRRPRIRPPPANIPEQSPVSSSSSSQGECIAGPVGNDFCSRSPSQEQCSRAE